LKPNSGGRIMDKEVIYMALKAGNGDVWWCSEQALERFFALAFEAGAAAEREACAKVCEQQEDYGPLCETPEECAATIRARSEK